MFTINVILVGIESMIHKPYEATQKHQHGGTRLGGIWGLGSAGCRSHTPQVAFHTWVGSYVHTSSLAGPQQYLIHLLYIYVHVNMACVANTTFRESYIEKTVLQLDTLVHISFKAKSTYKISTLL